jgi:hypothetical protein
MLSQSLTIFAPSFLAGIIIENNVKAITLFQVTNRKHHIPGIDPILVLVKSFIGEITKMFAAPLVSSSMLDLLKTC